MSYVKNLTRQALTLKPIERVQLVDAVLNSLYKASSTIDEVWIEEAEKRYLAYKQGHLNAISWEALKERLQ